MTHAVLAREAIVQAPINYLAPMDERPKFHAQDHRRDNLRYDPQVMAIEDARGWREQPSLEREGIALVSSPTSVKDFRDPDEVRRVYLPEVEATVQRATGAARVVVLGGGGLVRYTDRSPHFRTGMNTQPARFPHVDFTPKTSPGLADNVFGTLKAELRPGQRLVGFNIWRAISGPPQDIPLAVCDARTVAREDLVPGDGVYDEGEDRSKWWELEAYLLRHNPRHRWIWFRDMRPDEALMFRAYDNLPDWRAGVPHSAFDDPSCPPGGPPRVSVEARAFAIYD
jgi:hypothetical protein